MASFNKVIMLGNLTRDPQLSYLPSQTPVVEFGLATNRKFKGSDGSMRDDTCFVDCQAFGRMAENISKYCKKGQPLMIDGRLTFDTWEAQDGSKRSKHRVTIESFTFVGSGGASGSGGGGYSQNANPSGPGDGGGSAPAPTDDEVPF
jgi:single-strand DNA-binding protein